MKYSLANQRHIADKQNPVLRKEARAARIEKRKAYETHFAEKVETFLKDIDKENELAKMTRTFRFAKHYRRNKANKSRTYIPIQHWEQKLKVIREKRAYLNTLINVEKKE